jgi:Lar family restriction alleviation protein
MKELKPCPFCGERDQKVFLGIPKTKDWFVQCQTCQTTGPTGGDRESAVFQWNERAPTPTLVKEGPHV